MCTDEDVVRHYSLKFICEYWIDTEKFLITYSKHS